MIEAKTPLVGVIRGPTVKQSAKQKVLLMYDNAETQGKGFQKMSYWAEEGKACTAGYQPAAGSLCLGRAGVGNGAPEKVASELKTDMCALQDTSQRERVGL